MINSKKVSVISKSGTSLDCIIREGDNVLDNIVKIELGMSPRQRPMMLLTDVNGRTREIKVTKFGIEGYVVGNLTKRSAKDRNRDNMKRDFMSDEQIRNAMQNMQDLMRRGNPTENMIRGVYNDQQGENSPG